MNGVDYEEWSPLNDTRIAAKFSHKNLKPKAVCKQDLQKHFGLDLRADVPLIGFVGRFATQKGIELIAGVIDALMQEDIQVVMLGAG